MFIGLPFNAQSHKVSHSSGSYASVPPPNPDEPAVAKKDDQSFDDVSNFNFKFICP